MLIAFDFGITNTDVVLTKSEKNYFYSFPTMEINDEFISNILDSIGADVAQISHIAVTGGKSSDLNDKFYDIPIQKVNEVDAIGSGAIALYSIESRPFVAVSAGTGTACVYFDGKNFNHLGGISVGGGTYQGLMRHLVMNKDDNNLEKLAKDINKLKKSEITGEDLTGGYIIKIDKPDDEYTPLNSFTSEHAPYDPSGNSSVKFLYDTPDEEDITIEQREYISSYIKDFENALAGENFRDPVLGYNSYIDTDDFIDFFLLNELGNNVDGFRISTWMVKDKNEKLKMGPIWDFNLAFGNADYCAGGESNVWAYRLNERCPGGYWPIPFWWERLLQDPEYVSKVKSRWKELRGTVFSSSNVNRMIDDYELILISSGSIKRNFERWPVLGTYVWPNNYIGSDYSDEMKFIRNWITERMSWLDSNINSL